MKMIHAVYKDKDMDALIRINEKDAEELIETDPEDLE